MAKMAVHDRQVPFRELLVRTWLLLKIRSRSVFVGALSFALLYAVCSVFLQQKIDQKMSLAAADVQMTTDAFKEKLTATIQTISEADTLQFLTDFRTYFGHADEVPVAVRQSPSGIVTVFAVRTFSLVLINLFVSMFILFLTGTYFYLLATAGMQTAYEALQRLPGTVFLMIGLWFWMMVRSFVWVPFIGPFIALYLLPRLYLSPVLLASGEFGFFQSARESMRRTHGKWLTVVLRLLGIALLVMLMLWPVLVLVAIVAFASAKLGFFLWLLATNIAMGASIFAITVLTAMLG
jgi:hypothetical protein